MSGPLPWTATSPRAETASKPGSTGGDNEYPILTFFYAGNFSQLDVKSIDIDKDMDRMMVTLNDGTIIASENYFVPTEAMNGN